MLKNVLLAICLMFGIQLGLLAQIDWVGNMSPTTVTISEGDSENIYIQAYKSGVTEPMGQGAGINCEFYYGEVNNLGVMEAWTNISQLPMIYNVDIGNNDEYRVDVASLEDGLYEYTCRCSDDGGSTWTWAVNPGGNGLMTILAPLPVALNNFAAQSRGEAVHLNWSTLSENNASHFEIEKSVDGALWRTIGNVSALGNSNSRQDYNFVDNRPENGLQYYRLKQMDSYGFFEYSTVRSIQITEIGKIDIYPNPVKDDHLFISSKEDGWKEVMIYDVNGRKVFIERYTSAGIKVSTLPAGLYFLYLANEFGISEEKKLIIE